MLCRAGLATGARSAPEVCGPVSTTTAIRPSAPTGTLTTCADIPAWNPCGTPVACVMNMNGQAKIAAVPEAAMVLRGFGSSDCRCASVLVPAAADRDGVEVVLGVDRAVVTESAPPARRATHR